MHIPDGFIDAPTSAAAGVISAGATWWCLRRSGAAFDDRAAPLVGVVAAYVFAAQMLNFPVAAGTSGHLVGGTLAAVLVGPWAASLCLTVVLGVQALVFADGGLSALGLNVLNMAVVGVASGWLVFRVMRSVVPTGRRAVSAAAAVGSFVSVPAAALAFSVEYAIGGSGSASVRTVATAMVGVHALIGVGEAVITCLTLGAVLSTRPDLVFGARHLDPGSGVHVAPVG